MGKKKNIGFKSALLLGLSLAVLSSCENNNDVNNLHTISFFDNNNLITELKTRGNELINLPAAPEKTDYEFKGWFLDKNVWNNKLTNDYFLNKPLLEDIDCYAYYEEINQPEPEKYTISFYVDNELFSTIETSGNEVLDLPIAPEKTDYEFKGWYFDNETFKIQLTENYYQNSILENDVNVYAYYQLIEDVPTEYRVNFETNGGSAVEDIVTSLIETEPKTTKPGFTFDGWYTEETFQHKVTFPYEVTKDQTLYAKWEANTYNVHFVLNGGTGVNDIKTDKIEVEPIPIKDGYTFLGWYFESTFTNRVSFPFTVTKDETLYAKWEQNTYNVHFVLNGGTGISDVKTNKIEKEPIPTKEGFTFVGWYLEEEFINKVEFPYEVKNNVSLYAKWEENIPSELSFTVDENGVLTKVEGISADNSEVEIPSQVNNIEVTEIGDNVFANNTYLKKLIVPETVRILGYKFCYGCSNLTEVVLSNKITVIPDYAFEKCTSLEKINFPTSLVQIRNNAFTETALKEFQAPDSLREIWGYAFQGAKELVTVNLNKTTKLGQMAFENCEKITSIDLPSTLTEIDQYVFNGCKSLENINMPDEAITIERDMFTGTSYYENKSNWKNGVLYVDNYLVTINSDFNNVTDYTVQEGTISIANNAFVNYAKNLKSITLPEGLKIIGKTAFSSLYSLSKINIPSTVNKIGYNAFANTTIYNDEANWTDNGLYIDNWLVGVKTTISLTEFTVKEGTIGVADGKDTGLFPTKAQSINKLTLSSTLKYIGYRSFMRLKITELNLPITLETIGEGAFMTNASLTSVNLDECVNLQSIGSQAFSQASLKDITIPSNVTKMGELVFNNNTVDLTINCMTDKKPEGWDNDWNYTYSSKAKITVVWNS